MSELTEAVPKLRAQDDQATSPDFSVVIPVYQEHGSIAALISSTVEQLELMERPFEIIAVDDGSTDGTGEALAKVLARFPGQVRVARHASNRGNGAALRTGIRVARGEIVVTMDADGQHSAANIGLLLEQMPPFDLVVGARTKGYTGPLLRGLANWFYNRFASWLTRSAIADLTSGFRAMRRAAVGHFLPLFPEGFSAPTTTTMAFIKAGYNVAFVPVEVGQRRSGESKINLWADGVRFLTIMLRMIMLFDPLRIFLPVGFLLSVFGVAAWVAGVLAAGRLVLPNSSIFLFLSALTIWLLGLVSDQIASARIHYHGDETVELYGSPSTGEAPRS